MAKELGHSSRRVLAMMATGILLLIVPGASHLQAQEFRATLTGQVLDPTGAVVANAQVTAVNDATGQTYTGRTNSAGVYNISYVLPGTYTMTVSATGFKTLVQGGVLVQASESRGINFNLQLGTATQKVTVTTAPPLVDTVSGSVNTILTDQQIANLPLNGRQIYMLIGMIPGSQFTQETFGSTGFSGTRGWDVNNEYVLGGAIQGYNSFTLNGTNMTVMTGYGSEGTWMTAPNIDAIQEVNVMTHTYDSRYGQTAGGIVNIVTKNGTNLFHGDAYDYLEAGFLNANNFENNLNLVPRQDVHQEQYGGTIGGPIKKDKTFFFGSFEGYWENIPFTTITSVPTQAMRNGDFSQSGYEIFDPTTTVCTSPGGVIGNCPNNAYAQTEFTGDVIPTNRINSIGQAIVNLFPPPNINVSSPVSNYTATFRTSTGITSRWPASTGTPAEKPAGTPPTSTSTGRSFGTSADLRHRPKTATSTPCAPTPSPASI